ncbi:MAG: type IV pilus twitching motility protein PilT [Oligoflexia bacterium]|nr:type IV pilus twitching motility protein PilT [Oligoflexia bacterium]
MNLQNLLKTMVDENASDLHIVAHSPPVMRVNGTLLKLKSSELTSQDTKTLTYSVLSERQKSEFEEKKELDFSFGVKGLARFRGNMSYQRGSISAAFRQINYNIPSLKELGIPPIVSELTKRKNGLILVTGPTGCGKSTTLAALIDKINQEETGHIVTIEDPIEYLHKHKNCIVNQREVGSDTLSFNEALRHTLRQDPDYILVGELRDLETIESALKIAETGHLVFATLHTNSAIQTINRVVTVFPAEQQATVRALLSFVLQAVICQDLLPSTTGGRVLASEVLIPNLGIRNLIREDKLHQIYSHMQMGQTHTDMLTMNQSLMALLVRRQVTLKTAFEASSDPEELDAMLKKAGL